MGLANAGQRRLVGIDRHMIDSLHDDEFLVRVRYHVEAFGLEVCRGDIIAFGNDHQHRLVVDPPGIGMDIVAQRQFHRLDRVVMLMQRCLEGLDLLEDLLDTREGKNSEFLIRVGRGHRDHLAGAAPATLAPVFQPQLLKLREPLLAMTPPERCIAVDERNRADHVAHTGVGGSDDEDVPPAVRDAPHADPLRIDAGDRLGVAYRILVVLDLRPWIEMLPPVAVARAKIAIA